MIIFELKQYQQQALAVLDIFLLVAKNTSVEEAFAQTLSKQQQKNVLYRHYVFEQIPFLPATT